MTLSKREQILLAILIVSVVFFLFYRFIYVPKVIEIETIDAEIAESENLHTLLGKNLNSKIELEDSIKSMKIKVREMDRLLPERVYQEEVILYLENLIDAHDIKLAGIDFSTETLGITSLENANSKDSVEMLLFNYEQEKESKSLEELKNIGKENIEENADTKEPEVKQFEVAINFAGNYSDIKAFMDKIESNHRLIGIHSLSMNYDTETENIYGNMILSFPFYEDGTFNELLWEIESNYGKTDLFGDINLQAPVYGYTPDMTEFNRSDFYIFLDPVKNILPTVTLGKTPYNYTAIYSDSNSTETIKLFLKKDDSGYLYSYENSYSKYPTENGAFEVFEPEGANIVLNVYARSDNDLKDMPGTKLLIENETELPVFIHVIGDDSNNPSFKYEVVSGDVHEINIS
ncbi:MAG: hypothetical protein JJE29_04985 [Peptostreptococcaceae bacterium]|nr:hypothetical protein [Peptostreptococcaceae bacterium]